MIKLLSSRWNLTLVVMLAFAGGAMGQIVTGGKLGLNMNQFSQPGTTVGLNIGAYGTYQVTPYFTAKFEPHYSQEGGGRPDYFRSYTDISDNVSSITYMNPYVVFHNLQFPVLAEFTLPEFSEEAVKPKFIFGASYALVVSATELHTKRYTFVTGGGTSPGSVEPDARMDVAYQREIVTDNYARNQWNLWFGMGLDFKAGERNFAFDIRYRQGLTDLNMLRYTSPGNSTGTIGTPGTGGKLYSTSVSFNFSVSVFNF